MKKLILLLLFICSSQLFSQDYLITLSGKEYEGQYIGFKHGKVQFIQKGGKVPTDIPSSSVKFVKLANGKTLSFGSELLMNDGTNFKGSWIMTSKDIIRFLVFGEKITAQAIIGPAKGPLPTSSIPAATLCFIYIKYIRIYHKEIKRPPKSFWMAFVFMSEFKTTEVL